MVLTMKVHVPNLFKRVILYYSADLFYINEFFLKYFIIWYIFFFKECVFSSYEFSATPSLNKIYLI